MILAGLNPGTPGRKVKRIDYHNNIHVHECMCVLLLCACTYDNVCVYVRARETGAAGNTIFYAATTVR